MNFVVDIPEELARRLGGDVQRKALEALAIEAYRAGKVTKAELRGLLGIGSRSELDGLLKAYDVYEPITAEDVEQDVKDLRRLGL